MDELKRDLESLIDQGREIDAVDRIRAANLSKRQEKHIQRWMEQRGLAMQREAQRANNWGDLFKELASYQGPGETVSDVWDRLPPLLQQRLEDYSRIHGSPPHE